MALIQINAEFKALLNVLERIARACEIAVGLAPPPTGAPPEDEGPAVSYSTPEDALRAEWESRAGVPTAEQELP